MDFFFFSFFCSLQIHASKLNCNLQTDFKIFAAVVARFYFVGLVNCIVRFSYSLDDGKIWLQCIVVLTKRFYQPMNELLPFLFPQCIVHVCLFSYFLLFTNSHYKFLWRKFRSVLVIKCATIFK